MAFPVPRTLSPSKVSSFTDCALACLDEAAAELRTDPDYLGLDLATEQAAAFHAEAADLVRNYFRIEDPTKIQAIGLELKVEAEIDGIRLRGIIDRLELDADGELIVTDYKTGSAPSTQYERKRLSGVHIYSLLCEQMLGPRARPPAAPRLGPRPNVRPAPPAPSRHQGGRRLRHRHRRPGRPLPRPSPRRPAHVRRVRTRRLQPDLAPDRNHPRPRSGPPPHPRGACRHHPRCRVPTDQRSGQGHVPPPPPRVGAGTAAPPPPATH